MALSHDFVVIKTQDENQMDNTFQKVSISDELILYMKDSFSWVDSLWNGKKEMSGLNYYGYTIIANQNIVKLREIVIAWQKLFEIAPDSFFLTGNYLLDEGCYEKNPFDKSMVLLQLKSLCKLCESAIEENKYILHNGI